MPLTVYPIRPRGEMYQFDQLFVVDIAAKDIWYTITNFNAGELLEVLFQNGGELVVEVAGSYKINFNVCWTDGVGTLYKLRIAVNGTTVGKTQCCGRKTNALDIINTAGSAILDLAEGDIVTIEVLNATNVNDMEIIDSSVNIIRMEDF